MDDLKLNLRSKYLTDEFTARLNKGLAVVARLRALGVRTVRTDYGREQPLLEIDPLTAGPLYAIPVSLLSSREPGGMKRHIKVIDGCMVVWSVAI